MGSFVTDLRYGVRMLVKTPGLSLVAILTISGPGHRKLA